MYICWIFQKIVGCQNNHLSRVKTKEAKWYEKKPKYLSLICWKEFVLKIVTENQELLRNLPNINTGKLFGNIALF